MCGYADVQMIRSMFRLGLVIGLVFACMIAHAQFSRKLPNISISTQPSNNSLIYELPGIKLYFDKTDVIRILKTDSFVDRDSADSALLKQLQLYPNGDFVVKSTDTVYNPKTHYWVETNYELATRRILTYLFFGNWKFSIYDIKNKVFIKRIFLDRHDLWADIRGQSLAYDLYSSNGKLLYSDRAFNTKFYFLLYQKRF